MRATIEALGGEFRFESKVGRSRHRQWRRCAAWCWRVARHIATDHVVLAVGHSARDTFQMLHDRGVYIEAKPFSIGFRIEHPQSLIDRARFGRIRRPSAAGRGRLQAGASLPQRPLASTAFACARAARWSPPPREPGRVVTNGMSQYSRNERNANSGIVVGITPADYPGDPLAGIEFQRQLGDRAPMCWAAATTMRRASWSATSSRAGASTELGAVLPSLQAGRAPDRSRRAACRITRSRRSARRCRPSTGRSTASRCTMR